MTRKDVCKATGLSIKTLRLYEEKGLIAPERQYRGGREYRIYTPELVEELNKIVTLRKAQFTMDEIRTMQRSPEAIPEIFQDYRLWLQAQEQQFRALRQAAERIDPSTLQSVDGLITDMAQAAQPLPLPQMDRKPDFKRMDALEEPPRHVVPQTNLDDTVPSGRVFRQMSLMMDGDRSNNINVAFGQVNDLRRAAPEEAGPVRESVASPRWLRIIAGLLTALLVISAVLGCCQQLIHQEIGLFWWGLFGIFLLLRLAVALIPLYRSHKRWLSAATEQDQAAGGAAYAAAAAADKKRRSRILLLSIAGGIVVILLIVLLCRVMYREAHPQVDLDIAFVSSQGLYNEALQDLEQQLSPLAQDVNGDGKQTVHIEYRHLSRWDYEGITETELKDSVRAGDCALYLLSPGEDEDRNLRSDFYCRLLPEELGGEYLVDLTDCPGLTEAGLQGLTVYGLISKGATEEEYAMAVAMLRALYQGS